MYMHSNCLVRVCSICSTSVLHVYAGPAIMLLERGVLKRCKCTDATSRKQLGYRARHTCTLYVIFVEDYDLLVNVMLAN